MAGTSGLTAAGEILAGLVDVSEFVTPAPVAVGAAALATGFVGFAADPFVVAIAGGLDFTWGFPAALPDPD